MRMTLPFVLLKGRRMRFLQKIVRSIYQIVHLAFLLFSIITPFNMVAAQGFSLCSWPFEVTGQGITNIATPDTNATYWVMPVDTNQWPTMIINGEYPQARFFSFVTYHATGTVVDSLIDADIAPDRGSTNPFAVVVAPEPHNFTISTVAGSANVLKLGEGGFAFIVYRVYVPDRGLDRNGGVALPAVTLIAADGTAAALQPCPFAAADSSARNMITSLNANGFTDAANFVEKKVGIGPRTGSAVQSACNAGQPTASAITFASSNSAGSFFPNPATTYLQTPSFCFHPDSIVVIRGKAAVFPDTHDGFSVFTPAIDGAIQLRYWSMCNNDQSLLQPVVACQADWATKLDRRQSYTYVVSNDLAPPFWLPPDATWLPWGATDIPKSLIFRNTLPYNFVLTGDYYPLGVFCKQRTFIHKGWKACFDRRFAD
jgi:hypothetical protein